MVALLTAAATAQAITFNEVARFNVSFAFNADIDQNGVEDNPKYIGTNPNGVAWNGSKLYLAGYDNGGDFAGTALIEVINPTRTGLVTLTDADFSDAFAKQFPATAFRGYTGIAIQGDRVAAAYDAGSAVATGIQVFDTADNSKIWDMSAAGTTARGAAASPLIPALMERGAPGRGLLGRHSPVDAAPCRTPRPAPRSTVLKFPTPA